MAPSFFWIKIAYSSKLCMVPRINISCPRASVSATQAPTLIQQHLVAWEDERNDRGHIQSHASADDSSKIWQTDDYDDDYDNARRSADASQHQTIGRDRRRQLLSLRLTVTAHQRRRHARTTIQHVLGSSMPCAEANPLKSRRNYNVFIRHSGKEQYMKKT